MNLLPDIGFHFIVGFSGAGLTDAERELWRRLRPAGTIIFKRNLSADKDWPKRLKATLDELQQLAGRNEFIISVDHEGGRVHRFVEPVTHFPAPAAWTMAPHTVGAAMGRELRELGVNLNFAPSLDVLVEPKNKVIGDRSFGSDPEDVSRRALEFLDGLESEGVLGCAKHFPGHGGTIEDSHETLPHVATPFSILQKRELVPFRDYVASGRQLVMTSHVVFDEIDKLHPATLSAKILKDILRDELGFFGAIITDALDMNAVSGMPESQIAEQFIRASGDLFCVCQSPGFKSGYPAGPIESALKFAESLTQSAAGNSELERNLDQSKERIQSLFLRLKGVTAINRSTGMSGR